MPAAANLYAFSLFSLRHSPLEGLPAGSFFHFQLWTL